MKKIWKSLLLGAALAFSLAACEKTEHENFIFNVKDDNGALIAGTQNFVFREVREFPFEANDVSRVATDVPSGWTAQLDYSTHKLVVTAPAGSDQTAAQSGTIKLTATSNKGNTQEVGLGVAVSDASISFSLSDDIKELSLKYGESVSFKAEASNVYSVDYTAPKGWVVAYDNQTSTLTITAPSKSTADAELEGSISITPKSERGNSGNGVSSKVSIKFNAPSLQLESSELTGLMLASSTEVKASEAANVEKIELVSAPAGWTASTSVSASGASITVKAPEAGNGSSVGEGEFVFKAVSDTEEEAEVTLSVALKGINNAAEFRAWTNAWNNDTENLSDFEQNGEFMINSDIDVSDTQVRWWIWRDFSGVLNGNNHRLKVSLLGGSTIGSDNGHTAIFGTVKGTVKNIVLEGRGEADHQCNLAGLTQWSDGGRYENITSYLELVKNGSGNARQNTYFAGLVGDETNSANGGGKYINCHNKGKMVSNGYQQFLGGLVADVWDNPGMEMENCSNEAEITVTVSSTIANMGNWWLGGLVGKADGSGATIKNCQNKGNITVNYDALPSRCKGIGGLVGAFSGTLNQCTNEGAVVSKSNANLRESRVGGLVGYLVAGKGWGLKADGCVNKGAVTAYAENVGGLIGLMEACAEGAVDIRSCTNEANVTSLEAKPSCLAVGGLFGTTYNYVKLTACKNTGNVAGFPSVGGAGLIGRAADTIVIDGCENSGKVAVGAYADLADPFPLAAGLVVGVAQTVTITGSRNTGAVNAMVTNPSAAGRTYVSQRKLQGKEDGSTVDSETENASASAPLNVVEKANWTETIPSDWR